MEALYDIVKRINNAASEEEAKNIFYGKEGIHVNNTEYIKNIISSFINKKEHIIKKEGNRLIFDLDNYNEIWNIVFISEYIKENDLLYKNYLLLVEDIENVKAEILNIKKRHLSAKSPEEHAKINTEMSLKSSELRNKVATLESLKKVNENFVRTDWVTLENSTYKTEQLKNIELFKQAINIIHKLRNSLEHTITDYKEEISISNSGFNIKIPVEYLNGFNAGRIISKEKDKIIVEKTNIITSPILESLGYSPLEVESYFYNMNPSFIDYLLKITNYDVKKLYKIPTFLIENEMFLPILIQKGITIDEIINTTKEANISTFLKLLTNPKFVKHSGYTRESYVNKISDQIIKFSRYCIEKNLHFDEIPDYELVDNIIKLCEMNIEPKVIQILTYKSLKNPNSDYVQKEVEVVKELIHSGIDITWNNFPQCWIDRKEVLLFYIKEGYITKDEFNRSNFVSLANIDAAHKEWLKYMKDNDVSISQISVQMIEYSDTSFELLKNGANINMLNKFIDYSDFLNYEKSSKIYSYLNSRNIKFNVDFFAAHIINKSLFELNNFQSENNLTAEQIIDILGNLKNEEINYALFDELMYNNSQSYNRIIKAIRIFKKLDIDFTKVKIQELLLHSASYYDLASKLSEKQVSLKIIEILPENYEDIAIGYPEDILNLITFIENRCGKITHKLPLKLVEACMPVYEGITVISYYSEQSDRLNIKYENISILLDAVNNEYDRLEEFPIEFFQVDVNILKQMLVKYNSNINKSIFGVDNCKIISTLVYCNSVFSNYLKENNDADYININPQEIIDSCKQLSLNLLNIDEKSYISQFIYNYELQSQRTDEEIKINLLNKLRNAFVHFRFKPVIDEQGNICSDKIIIYDTTNNFDDNNFLMVIDISYLIELTRKIEIELESRTQSGNSQSRK